MAHPNLTGLKTHLNKTGSGDDLELERMLNSALDVVAGIVGPLDGSSVTETHYRMSSDVLVLRQAPAQSVTSISARYGPGMTFSGYLTTDYLLDGPVGVLRAANGSRFVGDFTVTYTTGSATAPPEAVELAAYIIAGHLWETQRGAALSPFQAAEGADTFTGAGFAIPNRARELLAPFARGPRVA